MMKEKSSKESWGGHYVKPERLFVTQLSPAPVAQKVAKIKKIKNSIKNNKNN